MTHDWNYWNWLRRPRRPEGNGYLPGPAADAQPQRPAMPQFGTAFAPEQPRPPVPGGGDPLNSPWWPLWTLMGRIPGKIAEFPTMQPPPLPFRSAAPLAAAPTIPQPVLPPSPGYGDFGLLGKGLFPEPPPSGGLLDWVGFGDFLTRNRGGQEPRFAREAPRPMWQNPDGGLLGMFSGSDGREDTTRSDKATGAPAATAMVIAGKGAGGTRPVYPPAQTTFDVGPPTSEVVDLETMMKAFQFDPNGRGHYGAAIEQTLLDPVYSGGGTVPLKAWHANDLADEAGRAMGKQFRTSG